MTDPTRRGISRQGLDAASTAEQTRKSNLLLEAQLLRAQQHTDAAAVKFAEAAEIEERLADTCEAKGLLDKAWIHHFSAVGCWAQAGNLHNAILLGEELLARDDLPESYRRRIQEYVQVLRRRRNQWAAESVFASTAEG